MIASEARWTVSPRRPSTTELSLLLVNFTAVPILVAPTWSDTRSDNLNGTRRLLPRQAQNPIPRGAAGCPLRVAAKILAPVLTTEGLAWCDGHQTYCDVRYTEGKPCMTILITGGSKGIGRGVAERFARDGEHVIINYASDYDAAQSTGRAILDAGGQATLIQADLGSTAGIDQLVSRVRESTETLDQVVHAAVYPYSTSALDAAIPEFNRALQVSGVALLELCQKLLPLFKRGSSIFYMSSRGSKLAVPNYVALGGPKALGEALVRYLAVDLAPHGVRVNTIACSVVLTDAIREIRPNADEYAAEMASKNPTGRNVTPEDIAAVIHHMSRPDMEMVTGRELFVDGGIYITTQ